MEFRTAPPPKRPPAVTKPVVVPEPRKKKPAGFARLRSWRPKKLKRRRLFVGIFGIILVVAAAWWFLGRPSRSVKPIEEQSATATTQQSGSLQKGTPSYATLLPAGKTIDQLGGWTRVSPPDRNPVYAFTDTIGEIPITVSQQPLPATFETDTAAQIEDLASGYHATRYVTVNDKKVFIGDSAKGPQSIIFATDALLILIKSSAPLTDDQWSDYITSLE